MWEADRDFPLIRETVRVVTRELLDAPGALRYLAGLEGEPRVLHPAAATPFTFGIVTSSFNDSVVMDDRTSMIEALHERVLAVLGETPEDEIETARASRECARADAMRTATTRGWARSTPGATRSRRSARAANAPHAAPSAPLREPVADAHGQLKLL